MTYNINQQIAYDFDIFLYDGEKLIHIATAGGLFPSKINNFDIDFRLQFKRVCRYRRTFNYTQNENLVTKNLLNTDRYYYFFNLMAKRGFYSYDKVFIDDIENQTYQLISKPKYDRIINLPSFNNNINPEQIIKSPLSAEIQLIKTEKIFPKTYEPFNIERYL